MGLAKHYHSPGLLGDYKHWTLDPRIREPRTQGPKDPRTRETRTQGPGAQKPSCVFMTEIQLQATYVNVLSSNLGCVIVSHRVHIVIHAKALFRTDCAISHYLLASSILSSLYNPRIISFIACKNTSMTSYAYTQQTYP